MKLTISISSTSAKVYGALPPHPPLSSMSSWYNVYAPFAFITEYCGQVKEDEMGRTCNTHGSKGKCILSFV
jgi:hypothetical protein